MEPAPLSQPHDPAPDPAHDATRRKFLGTLTGALAAGIVVQILGCTESDFGLAPAAPADAAPETGNPPAPAAPPPGGPGTQARTAASLDRTGSVSANHGHVAVVTGAAQDAGSAHVLNIQGSSDHNHTVSLTATDVYNLRIGAQVTKTSSSGGGHTHTVTFAMITSQTPNRNGDVSDNHGHVAVVTGVVQDSGSAFTLRIAGSAGHEHLVPLTAQEIVNLKAGGQVVRSTSPDATGHSHLVTFAATTSIWRPRS